MNNFALEIPLNSLSLGQVSVCIAKEIFKRGLNPVIFPISNVDLSSYEISEDFKKWLEENIRRSQKEHSRKNPVFKVWHLNSSLSSVSDKSFLMSFHETSSPTETEVNICNNQEKVFFASNYTCDRFKLNGAKNIAFCPLAFDKDSFSITQKQYLPKNITVFGLYGKLEPQRKRHLKVIRTWLSKYGNNKQFMLHCCTFNSFLKPEVQQKMLLEAVGNQRWWNVNFLPFLQTNKMFNDALNSANIVLGMSGGEIWGLPEFQSLCLGKHGVILNAHGYKEYADSKNAVLVEPNGEFEANDGMFFIKGMEFNQGNFYDWREEDFLMACDKAIERNKQNSVNEEGVKLQEQFTYKKSVDIILGAMGI